MRRPARAPRQPWSSGWPPLSHCRSVVLANLVRAAQRALCARRHGGGCGGGPTLSGVHYPSPPLPVLQRQNMQFALVLTNATSGKDQLLATSETLSLEAIRNRPSSIKARGLGALPSRGRAGGSQRGRRPALTCTLCLEAEPPSAATTMHVPCRLCRAAPRTRRGPSACSGSRPTAGSSGSDGVRAPRLLMPGSQMHVQSAG